MNECDYAYNKLYIFMQIFTREDDNVWLIAYSWLNSDNFINGIYLINYIVKNNYLLFQIVLV